MWRIHCFWSLWHMLPLLPRFLCQVVLVPVMFVFTSKSAQISGGSKISGSRDAKLKSRHSRRNSRLYFNPRGWLTLNKKNTAMKSVKNTKKPCPSFMIDSWQSDQQIDMQSIEHSHINSTYINAGHRSLPVDRAPHRLLFTSISAPLAIMGHFFYLFREVSQSLSDLLHSGAHVTFFFTVLQKGKKRIFFLPRPPKCLGEHHRVHIASFSQKGQQHFSLVALTHRWTQV